jgi:general nucleoside transport system ATP-binding protein
VVVISQDLDELLEVADRFAALNAGRLSASVPVPGLTMDRIGLMLGGSDEDQGETGGTNAAA